MVVIIEFLNVQIVKPKRRLDGIMNSLEHCFDNNTFGLKMASNMIEKSNNNNSGIDEFV